MNLKQYFATLYPVLKTIFQNSETLDNSVLIGVVREYIANQLLAFLPEPKETGWICDHYGKTTGQIDLMLVLDKALRIPAILSENSPVNGFFATQVCCAFEIKSGISSHISQIKGKVWECHRLAGGHSLKTFETLHNESLYFEFGSGIPICVIGNKGFVEPDKYQEHFALREGEEFSVDKQVVSPPTSYHDLIPDLLVDFSHDTLLVKRGLHPQIISEYFKLPTDTIHQYDGFTLFSNMSNGRVLMALLYYLDTIRLNAFISQYGAGTPLLDVFKE